MLREQMTAAWFLLALGLTSCDIKTIRLNIDGQLVPTPSTAPPTPTSTASPTPDPISQRITSPEARAAFDALAAVLNDAARHDLEVLVTKGEPEAIATFLIELSKQMETRKLDAASLAVLMEAATSQNSPATFLSDLAPVLALATGQKQTLFGDAQIAASAEGAGLYRLADATAGPQCSSLGEITIDPLTGRIELTPTAAGSCHARVVFQNHLGDAFREFEIVARPAVLTATLSPSTASRGTPAIACVPTATPAGTLRYEYQWSKNDSVIIAWNEAASTWSPASSNPGDRITCAMRLKDGLGNGSAVTSGELTLANDVPGITLSQNALTFVEDTTATLALTLTDADDALTCDLIQIQSNNLDLLPLSGIQMTGTSPACEVRFAPTADASGIASITFRVSDGHDETTRTLSVTVTSANDAPTMAALSNASTNEDAWLDMPLTLADIDSTGLSCASALSYSTSNSTLLSATAGVTFSGTWPACTARITPNANASGSTDLTFVVSDGSLSAQRSFTLTVNAVNDAPTLGSLDPVVVDEDTSKTIVLAVTDVDSLGLNCAGAMSYTSSDGAVVATTGGVTFSGTWPTCSASITPVANASGTTSLTFTVSDGVDSTSRSFSFTATAVDDAPVLSSIADASTAEDTATPAIAFTLSDVDSTVRCDQVTVSSSNATLVPNGNIVIAGGATTSCTVTVTPAANRNGTSDITLSLSDGTTTTTQIFTLTVTPVNDAPTGTVSCSPAQVIGHPGDNYSLTCSGASDPDTGDTLAYALVTVSGTCPALGSDGQLTGTLGSVGDCVYKVKACDGASACTAESSSYRISSFALSLSLDPPSLDSTCQLALAGSTNASGNLSNLVRAGDSGYPSAPGTISPTGISASLGTQPTVGDYTATWSVTSGDVGGVTGSTSVQATTTLPWSLSSITTWIKPRTPSATLAGAEYPGRQLPFVGNGCMSCQGEWGAVSAGERHTCAVRSDGQLYCWGTNDGGQLGDGTTTQRLTPVAANGVTNVIAVATGGSMSYGHTCAVDGTGNVKCWGNSANGQIGNGSNTTVQSTAVSVNVGTQAVGIATGWSHSCALLETGEVKCWGSNVYGQTGSGSPNTPAQSTTPVLVQSLTNAVAVAANGDHSCAVISNGTVKCWGKNSSYQLGDGTNVNSATPVTVLEGGAPLTSVRSVALGGRHACAVKADGRVACWGLKMDGSWASGTSDTTARTLTAFTHVVAVSAGWAHNCVLKASGTVQCYGSDSWNGFTILGDNTPADDNSTNENSPFTVAGLSDAMGLSSLNWATCVLTRSGALKCWGWGGNGGLGLNATTNVGQPTAVLGVGGTGTFAPQYKNCTARVTGKSMQIFDYTGATQSYVVPAGVTRIKVYGWGGGGAGGCRDAKLQGGSGAFLAGRLNVTPGETLNIHIGQGGGTDWNLGGAGLAAGGNAKTAGCGGKGGGASGIVRSSTGKALFIVGGGGGANGIVGGNDADGSGGGAGYVGGAAGTGAVGSGFAGGSFTDVVDTGMNAAAMAGGRGARWGSTYPQSHGGSNYLFGTLLAEDAGSDASLVPPGNDEAPYGTGNGYGNAGGGQGDPSDAKGPSKAGGNGRIVIIAE